MTRDYRTLDAIVVVGCVCLLGAIAAALVFVEIPQPNLPILASLASGTFGLTLGLYAGARWGNTQNGKRPPVDPAAGEPPSK